MSIAARRALARALVERRRVRRFTFGGVAEVSSAVGNVHIVAPVTNLGLFGCFVPTHSFLPEEEQVTLKIHYEGAEFHAVGHVAYALDGKGIGISFAAASRKDAAVLNAWLERSEGSESSYESQLEREHSAIL